VFFFSNNDLLLWYFVEIRTSFTYSTTCHWDCQSTTIIYQKGKTLFLLLFILLNTLLLDLIK